MAITLRLVKGTELTFAEVDDNFKALYYSASINGNTLSLWKTGSGTADTVNLSGLAGTTTGSFTGSFTGSILGTSSYAITASHALNAGGGSGFPHSGSAQITGSLGLTGSFSLLSGEALIGSGSSPTTAGGVAPTLYVHNNDSGYDGDLPIDTTLLIENNSTTYMGAISPTASVAGFYMGSPSDIFGASVTWGYNQGYLALSAAQVGHGVQFKVGNKTDNSMKLLPVNSGTGDNRSKLELTGSADITGSVTALVYTASTGFYANANAGFEFIAEGDNQLNIKHNTANKHIFILTEGSGGINLGTGGTNSQVILNAGHVTASGAISASGQGIFDGILVNDANYDAAGTAKYRIDGYSVLQNSGTTLKIAGNNYWAILTYGNEATDKHLFTGSIDSTGSISASNGFYGTSSWAVTASHALNAGGGGSAFPHSGSAQITGSLNVTGSTTLHNANNSVTSLALQVEGSGSVSGSNIFEVIGDSGTLFAVSDGLSGSLFSVNDISGIPVLEVRSDDSVLMGNNTAPSFNTTVKVTTLSGSDNQLFTLPTSSYDGVFVDYTLTSGSNARAGNMMAITIPGTQNATYTDTATSDIGNTATVELSAAISESTIRFRGDSTGTSTWTFKAIIRAI